MAIKIYDAGKLFHTLRGIGLSIFLLLLTTGTAAGRPPECKFSIETEAVTSSGGEGLRALCHLRTLAAESFQNEDGNISLAALNHATHITALTLRCARQVVFLSELEPSMFSSFTRLEDLSLLNCKITSLPMHSLKGLPHLRRFTLKAHHEEWPGAALELSPFSLTDLPRLEVLNLSFNNMWGLPSGTLCHLPSLSTLNLTHNSFHHMTDLGLGSVGGCSHPLLHLHLDYNQIKEVRERALEGARDLRLVSLSNNYISRLADWAFEGLIELRHLDLHNNQLVALPQSAFDDLNQLRDLGLSNNSLSSLPPRVFQSLAHLLDLNLSYNQLTWSPSNVDPFVGLIRLVILNLSFNQFSYLGPDTFRDLYSLQVLKLDNNFISELADNTFFGLTNVHTLQLSYNELTLLTKDGFRGLSVLTFLDIDHNKLSYIHDSCFDNCSSLEHISFAYNDFKTVPFAVSKILLLKTLDISNNKINSLNAKSFYNLVHLKKLLIHNNDLTVLTVAAFKSIPSLSILDVSYNKLSKLENRSLDEMPRLTGLNITHNEFTNLYGMIMNLRDLVWINASHNQLEWFDYAVIPRNLKWIDMSYNPLINKIGNHYKLQSKINLEVIYATNNNISQINSPAIPDSLRELYLSHNIIDYVASNTFKNTKYLTLIDLSYNNLTLLGEASLRLPPRNVSIHSTQPTLLLSGNPLECDCGAEWISRAAEGGGSMGPIGGSLLPRLGDVSNVKCKLAGLWRDAVVPIVTVGAHQFLCTYRRHCFPVCHCCEFDACDCEQTCPSNCTCYHDHTWSHNIVDCGEGSWTKMPSGVPMDVTEAFMDGNDIGLLTSHALIGRKNLRSLYLNNSHITTIQNRTFNGLKNLLILKLNNNFLEKLYGYEFIDLQNLLELHLDYNKLHSLGNVSFSPLRSLELLKLDHNFLTSFPVWNLALNPFLVEVSLSANHWSCECSYLANMRAWLEANRIKTMNVSLIRCYHNISGEIGPPILSDTRMRCDHYVANNNMNTLILNDYVMLVTISAVILIFVLCGSLFAIAYRRRLKLWAVTQYGKRLFEKSSSYVEEREKLFDAFISHSAKDSAWVCGMLAPALESRGYRLCVTHRDCTSSSSPLTGQCITESIACSKRVIIVISKGFTDAEWCRYEFKSAHLEAFQSVKRKHIIIIRLEEVPKSEFDTELNAIIKSSHASVAPRDPRFWDRLRKALPAMRHKKRHKNNIPPNTIEISKPLVPCNDLNGPNWQLPESKSIYRVSDQSLTVNPYWETALTTDDDTWHHRQDSMNNRAPQPPWVSMTQVENPLISSIKSDSKNGDHTYMTMSECGETTMSSQLDSSHTREGDAESEIAYYPKSVNEDSFHKKIFYNKNNVLEIGNSSHPSHSLLRTDGSDYLTRSWIFHPPPDQHPPPPGQTYFV